MLKLNVAKFSGSADFGYEEGELLADVAKGMRISFTKQNLASDKRVTIIARNSADESFTIPCSANVSKAVRKALKVKTQKQVLATLLKLSVRPDKVNPEKYFIMAPAGTMSDSFLVDDLKAEKVEINDLLEAI